MTGVRIGVLALQGAFREHVTLLKSIPGVEAVEVRNVDQLESVSGLIIPGGESTTMALIAQRWGVLDKLKERVQKGLPVWGTCAGMIFLADRAEGQKSGGQAFVGGLDICVHRNFFGAQVESFEAEIPVPECLQPFGSEPIRAVFIRAPAVLEAGPGVEVISSLSLNDVQRAKSGRESVSVAVRTESLLATAFHPELTGDARWTQLFVSMVESYVKKSGMLTEPISAMEAEIGRVPNIPNDLPVFGHDHICA
ncbi:hypothetical protein BSKO_04419 [Bryopsis sp. KO-2023]|nr:hypothetical protein BSKO_04419 [Bryopsis sp. KO-2023]